MTTPSPVTEAEARVWAEDFRRIADRALARIPLVTRGKPHELEAHRANCEATARKALAICEGLHLYADEGCPPRRTVPVAPH